MKQKYTIHKDTEKKTLVIKEYGELNKEILSLLYEETYQEDEIKTAISESKEKLISILRTPNMYPPRVYANSIADLVIVIYESNGDQATKIWLDDKDFLQTNEPQTTTKEEPVEGVDDDIDTVLGDDIEEVYEKNKIIKDLKSTLKVADEDSADTDDNI